MKNSQFKIGQSVVFAGFDGGSYSATVTDVRVAGSVGNRTRAVVVQYFPSGMRPVHALLEEKDWGRLTPFGNSMFLALA